MVINPAFMEQLVPPLSAIVPLVETSTLVGPVTEIFGADIEILCVAAIVTVPERSKVIEAVRPVVANEICLGSMEIVC